MSKYKYASAKARAEKASSGFESTTIRVPEGVNFLSVKKEGVYKLDVLPYVVGKGNPYADEGMLHYERTYWIHRNVGPASQAFVCLLKTYHKRCPVCEAVQKLRKDGDQEAAKSLKLSERQLMNVIDLGDPDRGVQLLEISKFCFGKQIDDKILLSEADDNYENFFHLQGGMTLRVAFEQQSMGGIGNPYMKAVSIDMKARKDYQDDVLENCMCLDDLIVEMKYDDLKRILEGETDGPGDDDAPPARTPPGKPTVTNKTATRKPIDPSDDEESSEDEEARPARGRDDEDEERPVQRRGRVTEDEESRPRFSRR